jgi:hypothetical protein
MGSPRTERFRPDTGLLESYTTAKQTACTSGTAESSGLWFVNFGIQMRLLKRAKVLLVFGVLFLFLPPARARATFTVVLLPDTQYVISQQNDDDGEPSLLAMAQAEANWACNNKAAAVIGLGDITDDASAKSFSNSWTNLYQILDKCGVPYLPAVGNHDYQGAPSGRDLANYNARYGTSSPYASHSWYGGGQPSGTNDNSYITFSAGGQSFLVLSLQFYATAADVTWAKGIVTANPTKLVIIETHGHLFPDVNGNAQYETGTCTGSEGMPSCYGLNSSNSTDAPTLWTNLISKYPNIIFVICGHDWFCTGNCIGNSHNSWPIGATWRQDASSADGHLIPQMVSDYQELGNGGAGGILYGGGLGYMRVLTFSPKGAHTGSVSVTTYSPWCAANPTYCPLGARMGNKNAAGKFHDINQFSFRYGPAPVSISGAKSTGKPLPPHPGLPARDP